jgi:hypothetical protein
MAIYSTLFGRVELPDTLSPRSDRNGMKPIGVRLVRQVDASREQRHESSRSRP